MMNNSGSGAFGGGMIPRSNLYQARIDAAQRKAAESQQGAEQRQAEGGQTAATGANLLGMLGGAIAGGVLSAGNPAGIMAGAGLGGSIGSVAGKGAQMVIDPNSRTPANVMGMAQGAMGAVSGGNSFIDKYGRRIPVSVGVDPAGAGTPQG